jgi:hypothetical protein
MKIQPDFAKNLRKKSTFSYISENLTPCYPVNYGKVTSVFLRKDKKTSTLAQSQGLIVDM